MYQPDELKSDEPLVWSPGRGADVWAMFQAARAGDVPALERLVASDPSLVRAHYQYQTSLAFAVRENQVEAAAWLLDHGGRMFGSPLDLARDRGYADMERTILEKLARFGVAPGGEEVAATIRARDLPRLRALLDASPELVHAADESTNRPIHWAAMTRQPAAIDELLARGADIEARRMDGARPIQLANGDYDYRGWRDVPPDVVATPRHVIDHLRARGAACDICTAAHIGDAARVRELLAQDPSLANRPSDYVTYYACSGTPLRNAAAGGHLEIVRLLLDHGADPNLPEEHIAPRGHALHAAVHSGHGEIVELLLARGALPNVPIESSADTLSAALRAGDRDMVELLCSHGAARSVELLAYYGDVETAAAVFATDPSCADDPPALENAARQGHGAFVWLLLHHAPELPRRVAVGAKTAALTQLLFRHGMDPNHASWLGVTALHRCAGRGDVDNAVLFLERGATLDVRDDEYRSTPLAWAAREGQTAMAELLLARGARLNLPDDPPWATPLAWARRRGHGDVVDLLQRHGAA